MAKKNYFRIYRYFRLVILLCICCICACSNTSTQSTTSVVPSDTIGTSSSCKFFKTDLEESFAVLEETQFDSIGMNGTHGRVQINYDKNFIKSIKGLHVVNENNAIVLYYHVCECSFYLGSLTLLDKKLFDDYLQNKQFDGTVPVIYMELDNGLYLVGPPFEISLGQNMTYFLNGEALEDENHEDEEEIFKNSMEDFIINRDFLKIIKDVKYLN